MPQATCRVTTKACLAESLSCHLEPCSACRLQNRLLPLPCMPCPSTRQQAQLCSVQQCLHHFLSYGPSDGRSCCRSTAQKQQSWLCSVQQLKCHLGFCNPFELHCRQQPEHQGSQRMWTHQLQSPSQLLQHPLGQAPEQPQGHPQASDQLRGQPPEAVHKLALLHQPAPHLQVNCSWTLYV